MINIDVIPTTKSGVTIASSDACSCTFRLSWTFSMLAAGSTSRSRNFGLFVVILVHWMEMWYLYS